MIVESNGFQPHLELQSDPPGHLFITGAGVNVRIGRNVTSLWDLQINLGPGCSLTVEDGCHLEALVIRASNNSTIEIGEEVRFVHAAELHLAEPSTIIIGRGCLFATGTSIFTSDYHSILDAGTGRRLNHARDVVIGPEVWFGQSATVLKGARIGPQSIIGFGAVVSGEIPANTVAAGNPARVVRRGVRWTHALIE